jgi:hypothetical protein
MLMAQHSITGVSLLRFYISRLGATVAIRNSRESSGGPDELSRETPRISRLYYPVRTGRERQQDTTPARGL